MGMATHKRLMQTFVFICEFRKNSSQHDYWVHWHVGADVGLLPSFCWSFANISLMCVDHFDYIVVVRPLTSSWFRPNAIKLPRSIESVKCYPVGRKIDLIPSIYEILSQKCYHCVQYTETPSYEPNLTLLSPFPTEWTYLSMLFFLEVVCTACTAWGGMQCRQPQE